MLVVNSRIQIPLSEFEFTYARSSGPGGQNVNKVNSKATLRWNFRGSPSVPDDVRERFVAAFATRVTNEGDVLVVSQRYRDQAKNIDDCLAKLREMLASIAVAPRKRRATKPTRGSKERRLRDKRADTERKRLRGKPGREE